MSFPRNFVGSERALVPILGRGEEPYVVSSFVRSYAPGPGLPLCTRVTSAFCTPLPKLNDNSFLSLDLLNGESYLPGPGRFFLILFGSYSLF